VLLRLRPARVARLARREVPRPVDVINLIRVERFSRYRWYGLLVAPLLVLAGGRVRWMGERRASLLGEPQADKLLVVRYPSHRRFLAMTLNPYYLAINRLREAGVSSFEASFAHASSSQPDLHRRDLIVVAHFNSRDGADALTPVREVLEPIAGELVYAARETAAIDLLSPPRATDPNPLTLRHVAFFAPADGAVPAAAALEQAASSLAPITNGMSVQAYRREPAREYQPFRRRPAAK
jgi:uncharacterized protein (DUF1330 family)